MKITFNRESFLKSFGLASSFAPMKSKTSILSNVKLTAGQSVTLTATDIDTGIEVTCSNVTCDGDGSLMLSRERIGAILNQSNDENMTIEQASSGVTVKGKSAKFKLNCEDADSFPSMTFQDGDLTMPTELTSRAIGRTQWATDEEATRYSLNGVHVIFGSEVTFVGTDGRRLSVFKTSETCKETAVATIPVKAMRLIDKVTQGSETATWGIGDGSLFVNTDMARVFARGIEGRYPSHHDILKGRPESRIDIMAGPILQAVRQAAIVSSVESRAVKLTIAGGLLELSSTTAEVGTSNVEMPIAWDGGKVELAFDHGYLQDFFKCLEPTTMVEWYFKEGAASHFVADGCEYVVMPIVVNS